MLAGGTFLGILMNQGFLAPAALLSLGRVPELRGVAEGEGGELRLGAMATQIMAAAHRRSDLADKDDVVALHQFHPGQGHAEPVERAVGSDIFAGERDEL